MGFREIAFGSAQYDQALQLREAVLRRPLGLHLSAEDLANEERQYHFGIFAGDNLLATLCIKPFDDDSVKLRQMCVIPNAQGRGIGKLIITETERHLAMKGYRRIEMSARLSAVDFYKSLGYEVEGAPYFALGIEHVNMSKNRNPDEAKRNPGSATP